MTLLGICDILLCMNDQYLPNLDTWIVSDTHFFHANIIKFCHRPQDWQEKFVAVWQDLIGENDDVLHLGDVAMGQKVDREKLLPTLSGNKYMLRGNHDHESNEWYAAHGFQVVGNKSRLYTYWNNKKLCISHYPNAVDWQWHINIHGHIHNNGYAPGTPQLDYRNVSIEVMDYKPVRLRDILEGNSYESRQDAPDWPISQVVTMEHQNKLTPMLAEREFLT